MNISGMNSHQMKDIANKILYSILRKLAFPNVFLLVDRSPVYYSTSVYSISKNHELTDFVSIMPSYQYSTVRKFKQIK